jgi:hypothetical protein
MGKLCNIPNFYVLVFEERKPDHDIRVVRLKEK